MINIVTEHVWVLVSPNARLQELMFLHIQVLVDTFGEPLYVVVVCDFLGRAGGEEETDEQIEHEDASSKADDSPALERKRDAHPCSPKFDASPKRDADTRHSHADDSDTLLTASQPCRLSARRTS